jgi:anti-sigma regulatory factor (Ser/Thr protein kinase)
VITALDALPDEVAEDGIVTMVYLLLDPATGHARLARAGHLPPVLVPPNGPPRLLDGGGSPPLGVPVPIREESTVDLEPGSTLVLFTDGLVEDRANGLDVGLPAVVAASARLAAETSVERIADGLLATFDHAGHRPDDTCLLVVRLDPAQSPAEPAAAGTAPLPPARHELPALLGVPLQEVPFQELPFQELAHARRPADPPGARLGTAADDGDPGPRLDLTCPLPALPRSATVARSMVAGAISAGCPDLDDERRDTLLLLCSELVTNALVHAGGLLTVRFRVTGGRFRLEVHDGSVSAPAVRAQLPGAESGRGLLLVSELADDWGVDFPPEAPDGDRSGGKTVWAELSVAAPG